MPSGITPWLWVLRIAWQRLVLPERQNLQLPHPGVYGDHVVALGDRGDTGADLHHAGASLVAKHGWAQALGIGA